MATKINIQKGELYYIRGSVLGIQSHTNQFYKVQTFLETSNGFIVEVKHYKTKECNKVHIFLNFEDIINSIKYI